MNQIRNIKTGDIFTTSEPPVFIRGVWECGNQRFTDEMGTAYECVQAAPMLAIISPPEMRLLYTSFERQFLKANIASATPDPTIKDFFEELADPQLKEVNLNLASVQGAIQYSINFAGPHLTPPYTADDIARRIAEMMSAKLQ